MFMSWATDIAATTSIPSAVLWVHPVQRDDLALRLHGRKAKLALHHG
jgi:hypothetical protein